MLSLVLLFVRLVVFLIVFLFLFSGSAAFQLVESASSNCLLISFSLSIIFSSSLEDSSKETFFFNSHFFDALPFHRSWCELKLSGCLLTVLNPPTDFHVWGNGLFISNPYLNPFLYILSQCFLCYSLIVIADNDSVKFSVGVFYFSIYLICTGHLYVRYVFRCGKKNIQLSSIFFVQCCWFYLTRFVFFRQGFHFCRRSESVSTTS